MDTLYTITKELQESTPTNQYQLPDGFYRCDLLASIDLDDQLEDTTEVEQLEGPGYSPSGPNDTALKKSLKSCARHAYVPLDYSEGFPALQHDGTPFWYQLPHEAKEAFDAFQYYLILPRENGVRTLSDHYNLLPKELQHRFSPDDLFELKTLYYWLSRAKAYDAFDTMARRKQRSIHANAAEDRHFHLSELLLKKAASFIQSEGFLEGMNTKTALEALKLGVQVQRQSLGLSPTTVGETSAPQVDMEVELLKTMNPNALEGEFHGNQRDASEIITLPDGTQVTRGSSNSKMAEVLRDPDALGIAQRLVIKVSTSPTVE